MILTPHTLWIHVLKILPFYSVSTEEVNVAFANTVCHLY